jgi:putative ABC transport system substrate-binding protein
MKQTGAHSGRRSFLQCSLALAGLGLLAGCVLPPLPGQQPATVPRIGYLAYGRSGPGAEEDAFRQGLGELGYVEGGNLAIEWRFTEQTETFARLAADLVQLQVAVIVAAGAPAVGAAKNTTSTIPIVMPVSGDPVGQGYVASLARPGGTITGLTNLSSSPLAPKRLQLLKDIVPRASRVTVLWNPDSTAKALELQEAQNAATALGLTLLPLELRGRRDFDRAFEAVATEHVDGLSTLSDGLTFSHRALIAEFALTSRLPSVFDQREFVTAGGLVGYGPNILDLFRRSAVYVDKILKGARPADLPVEQPSKFDFVVNLKTARELGLSMPQSALQEATEVID